MAVYWMTEAVPIPITGILPLIFLPLFGIESSANIVKEYIKDSTMVLFSGFFVAIAFEYSNLHSRIALNVMFISGGNPGRLMLGLMLTTMFLSMWMFNTACVVMMIPIISALLDEIQKMALSYSTGLEDGNIQSEISEIMKKMKKMFLLGICYAANIGGTGVVTGTSTNLIALEMLGNLDTKKYGNGSNLTFVTWMAFSIPPMLVNTIFAWIYLYIITFGFNFGKRKEKSQLNIIFTTELKKNMKKLIKSNVNALGKISTHEICVFILFLICVSIWILHDPKVFPGWASFFTKKVGIPSGGLLIGIIFFCVPKNKEFYNGFFSGKNLNYKLYPLLEWNYVQQRIPWDLPLLLGGGYAIAAAIKKTGLSSSIGEFLSVLKPFPPIAVQIICLLLIVFATEIVSNAATASIVLPVLLELGDQMGLHPLYLTVPAAVTCSYAFMLPVATSTNTLVYSKGQMQILDMMKPGLCMNIITVLILTAFTNTYGNLIFNFNSFQVLINSEKNVSSVH